MADKPSERAGTSREKRRAVSTYLDTMRHAPVRESVITTDQAVEAIERGKQTGGK